MLFGLAVQCQIAVSERLTCILIVVAAVCGPQLACCNIDMAL